LANTIQSGPQATISGGYCNSNACVGSTIGGGGFNTIEFSEDFEQGADLATIGGGYGNKIQALAEGATIPGGLHNLAGGFCTFAAGRRANALHDGAFVWADSADADFDSTRNDQFNIRAAGGVYVQSDRGIGLNAADRPMITRGFDTFDSTAPPQKQGLGRWGLFMEPYNLVLGIPGDDVPGRNFQVGKYAKDGSWIGLMLVDQSGAVQARVFNATSDRAAKEHFTPVNPREILAKVACLPVSQWYFKQDASARHLGPVAQDFHAAFGLGADDKHIATVDADGVALVAIQGLNQKVEEQRAENAELKRRLAHLEQLVLKLTAEGE
jgi:hypothetical protein